MKAAVRGAVSRLVCPRISSAVRVMLALVTIGACSSPGQATSASDPLAGQHFYVPTLAPIASALKAAQRRDASPTVINSIEDIAHHENAIWLTGNSSDYSTVSTDLSAAAKNHQIPVFVLYAIPDRD